MRTGTRCLRLSGVLFAALASGCTLLPDTGGPVAPAPDGPAWAPPPELSVPVPVRPEAPAPEPTDLWTELAEGLVFAGVQHERVAAQRRWLDRYPEHLKHVTDRARPFLPAIVEALKVRGMPLDLALLPALESGYRPEATSPRGAAGLWQFMSGTARHLGLRVDGTVDDRREFARSTRAALDHLAALSARFDGDWLLAVAAYNCGEHCVARARRRARARQSGPTPAFWALDLPRETMRYVPRWLALVDRFQAEHGELTPLPPGSVLTEVTLAPPIDLVLARDLSGLPDADFRRFNGRYRPETLVPVVDRLWLPSQTVPSFEARLAALTPAERRRRMRYRVQRGDSLWRIARRHSVSVDYLRRINGIGRSALLHPGQILKLVESAPADL